MMAGMPAPLLKPMIKPFLVGMAGDVAPLLGKVRGAQPSHTGAAPLTVRSRDPSVAGAQPRRAAQR